MLIVSLWPCLGLGSYGKLLTLKTINNIYCGVKLCLTLSVFHIFPHLTLRIMAYVVDKTVFILQMKKLRLQAATWSKKSHRQEVGDPRGSAARGTIPCFLYHHANRCLPSLYIEKSEQSWIIFHVKLNLILPSKAWGKILETSTRLPCCGSLRQ